MSGLTVEHSASGEHARARTSGVWSRAVGVANDRDHTLAGPSAARPPMAAGRGVRVEELVALAAVVSMTVAASGLARAASALSWLVRPRAARVTSAVREAEVLADLEGV